ncbi:MAG: acetyl-CoA carboxylase biotin carboxyl carrier protein [Phycisphaerales bacterium]
MIDIRKLKELVKLMVENDLSELDLRDEQETVVVKRGYGQTVIAGPMPMAAPMMMGGGAGMVGGGAAASGGGGAASGGGGGDDESGLHAIVSPMVGTFYASPDPDSPAYVSVGASVGPESVVCIVEAMKVFSEIKAECSGTVEKVLVKAGDPVEYGQKLFLVRLS